MANYNMPKITEEDMQLFHSINRYGFVDIQYIYSFYKTDSRTRTIDGRINQLVIHEFLSELKTFVPPEYTAIQDTAYKIYCLDKKGIQLMEFYYEDVDDKTSILKNAPPYRMYHQVQVATVCEMIKKQFLNSDSIFEVDSIFGEKEVFIEETNNMPDALVLFKMKNQENGGLVALFIEIERSYTTLKRLENKLRRYKESFQDKIYAKEFRLPIISYRVLFVAQTTGQFTGIQKKIAESKYAKDIEVLLVGYQDICDFTMEPIYTIPGEESTVKLLGKIR